MKKKLLALVCALALTVSLVGCALSTPDTVGKIGDFEVTSGLYLLAQYDAYQQAAQLADSEQDTSKVKSFLKATITTDADTGETAVVKDYVAQKTLETLQTLAAVDARFTELGGELTEEQKSAADSYAQQLMDNYGDAYTANGIGLETLKLFQQLQYKHTLLLSAAFWARESISAFGSSLAKAKVLVLYRGTVIKPISYMVLSRCSVSSPSSTGVSPSLP